MSSKRGRIRNKSPTATAPDITYTDPVNCQWDTCGQQFSCIYGLVQHIKKTHILKGTTKDYVCLWRNCWRNRKPFKNQSGLVTHLRSHSGENPHRCLYPCCNQTFTSSSNLKLHIRRHNGEKPYICQIQGCNKSFVNSSERSHHQKTHSKQKPFACTFPGCDKKYKDQSTLKTHITEKHSQRKKPTIETSEELDNSLSIQSLQNNRKSPNKKHYTHHDKGHYQYSEIEVQALTLKAALQEQHPSHTQIDNEYLQPPFPAFAIGLPDINTIFNAQDFANYLPNKSNYTDLQSQSYSRYQSLQLADFSQHLYNPESLDIPSPSSMTSSTNFQSIYKQCIPSCLPPYEDIQCWHYKSPLTTTQLTITSHQQDYSAMPTLSMSN